jgi:hypothetical protein
VQPPLGLNCLQAHESKYQFGQQLLSLKNRLELLRTANRARRQAPRQTHRLKQRPKIRTRRHLLGQSMSDQSCLATG